MTGARGAPANAKCQMPNAKSQRPKRRGQRPDGLEALEFGVLELCDFRRGRAAAGQPPILKLELTWKTALTMAKAMKPTKMKTIMSTPLAMTLVKVESWLEISFW